MRSALFLLLFASPVLAQEASPYVSISWWGTPYVDHLIARSFEAERRENVQCPVDDVDTGLDAQGPGGARRRTPADGASSHSDRA